MTRLFGRTVRVVVGPAGARGVEISGAYVKATIDRTKSSKPDKAKIEIYNLSRALAAAIEDTNTDPPNVVQIFAGYGPAPPRVFAGEIRRGRARTVDERPDRITTIEAKDGGAAYRSARLNKSWGRGVKAREIIAEIGEAFGSPVSLPPGIGDLEIVSGLTAAAPAREVLDRLAESMGFEWAFEDGAVVVTPAGGDTGEEAVIVAPQTGLIGSITPTDKGIEATSLLNPRIRPRRIVALRGDAVRGYFLVQKTRESIDSRGGDFFTKFEAREIQT